MLDANTIHISLALKGSLIDLQVLSFVGHEALNQPFCFDIELVSCRSDLKLEELLHEPGSLSFGVTGKSQIRGLVYRIEQGDSGKNLTRYSISLVPRLAYLRHNYDLNIFQHQTVPKIIAQILEARGILVDAYSFQLSKTYTEREYCVQYDESDLHFIQRLCEEEGIHFHFQHSTSGHTLVFGDDQSVFRKLAPINYQQDSEVAAEQPLINYFNLCSETSTTCATQIASAPDFEDCGYPRRLAQARGKQLATCTRERYRGDYALVEGSGNEPTMLTGHCLTMADHPCSEWNEAWLLLDVIHEGKQPQVLGEHTMREVADSKEDFHQGYRNHFLAIPWGAHYRPAVEHKKSMAMGSQIAIVTGLTNDESQGDQIGRVKVQFFWGREGEHCKTSSCWLPVAAGWAGNAYGGLALPLLGMEVLVSFMDGDPDQPLIIGCLLH